MSTVYVMAEITTFLNFLWIITEVTFLPEVMAITTTWRFTAICFAGAQLRDAFDYSCTWQKWKTNLVGGLNVHEKENCTINSYSACTLLYNATWRLRHHKNWTVAVSVKINLLPELIAFTIREAAASLLLLVVTFHHWCWNVQYVHRCV